MSSSSIIAATSTDSTSSSSSSSTRSSPKKVTIAMSSTGSQSDDNVTVVTNGKPPSETEITATELDMMESGTKRPKVHGITSDLPRLVLRNRPFHQSSNKVHIQHNKQGFKILKLLKSDWFHAILRWPTSRLLLMLMSIWTGAILFFAGVYVWYDNLDTTISCGLGAVDEPVTFAASFAFSLETCTTVGYGLPHGINSFFEEGCSSLQIIIYFQMAWSMIFNAFLLTFLYNRLARSSLRGAQVICSQKALVSVVNGQVRFQIRLFDADAEHPVVEAHVRLYAVMKHRPVPRPLRMLQPDDDLGGMLFLSFPTVISHHVDLYSLLHPPTAAMNMNPAGLVLRQADGDTAGRDDVICPVCGESYGTLHRWKNHVRFQQIVEAKDEYPISGTHLSLDMEQIENQAGLKSTRDLVELKDYFENNVSEVICVVEGIDPLQSGTFQSLQSYRFEDLVWEANSQFAPCLEVIEGNRRQPRSFQVDLDRYHDIVLDPELVEAEKAAVNAEKTGPKKKHRRIKSSSRRYGDALFSSAVQSSHVLPHDNV
ncbi:activated inward rectifier potassium channel 3 [Seminavis robusta]|uniref:Activated inward rectifier potassium channel 3 n=1 Tax=Seminavis robusta TaxID=568900 RepID=A0A9N8HHK5_9STRA|nr:activated inward rectifier potassium channel 3 [Seminavis robusta]|eukprot:Sro643_g180300.1 activated inward rectifier potassium channel 3 (540) ;mRNA; r:24397-26109